MDRPGQLWVTKVYTYLIRRKYHSSQLRSSVLLPFDVIIGIHALELLRALVDLKKLSVCLKFGGKSFLFPLEPDYRKHLFGAGVTDSASFTSDCSYAARSSSHDW